MPTTKSKSKSAVRAQSSDHGVGPAVAAPASPNSKAANATVADTNGDHVPVAPAEAAGRRTRSSTGAIAKTSIKDIGNKLELANSKPAASAGKATASKQRASKTVSSVAVVEGADAPTAATVGPTVDPTGEDSTGSPVFVDPFEAHAREEAAKAASFKQAFAQPAAATAGRGRKAAATAASGGSRASKKTPRAEAVTEETAPAETNGNEIRPPTADAAKTNNNNDTHADPAEVLSEGDVGAGPGADAATAAAGSTSAPPPAVKQHRSEHAPPARRAAVSHANSSSSNNKDFFGRLKVLSVSEKKACQALRDALLVVGAEAAARTNRVPQLAHDLHALLDPLLLVDASSSAADADANDNEGNADNANNDADAAGKTQPSIIPLPPADVPACIKRVLDAVDAARSSFDANVDECQLDLDEHLIIRPIAHAIATELNHIEGFVSPVALEYTERQREARKKVIDTLKAKREKLEDKSRAKAAEVLAKAEEKKRNEEAAKAAKGLGIEDTLLAHASPVSGVVYAPLPLLSPVLFSDALRCWSMITSIPKAVRVSQMPFSTFLLALHDSNPKATLMRDVLRGLVQACGGDDIVSVRGGKEWFANVIAHFLASLDEMVEETVASASGKKLTAAARRALVAARRKAREEGRQARQRHHHSDSDGPDYGEDDEDDEDDDDDDEDAEDDDDEEEEGDSEEDSNEGSEEEDEGDDNDGASDAKKQDGGDGDAAAPATKKTRPETAAQRLRRETLERQAPLRDLHAAYSPAKHCAWHIVTLDDRLRFLTFYVNRALKSKLCAAEAEAVQERCRADVVKHEKKCKEILDEANAAIRTLNKTFAANKPAAKKAPKGKKAKGSAGVSAAASDDENASPATKTANASQANSDAEGDDDDDETKLLNVRGGRGANAKKAGRGGKAPSKQEQALQAAATGELSKDELESQKKELLAKAEKTNSAAYLRLRERWEKEDHGMRILPLGEDRHRRLVWYFPQDRRLLVQTIPNYSLPATNEKDKLAPPVVRVPVWGTPAIAPPSVDGAKPPTTLIDDEPEDDSLMARRTRGAGAGRNAPGPTVDAMAAAMTAEVREALELSDEAAAAFEAQTVWGYVAASQLNEFVQSLDERGRREGPLRRAVERLIPHIEKQDVVMESLRTSRRTQSDFGFTNRQRPTESGWNW